MEARKPQNLYQRTSGLQSLWSQVSRRPALIENLKEEKNRKPGQISLKELLEWLWGLGAAPERACRVYALLLLQGLNQLACDVASPPHPCRASDGARTIMYCTVYRYVPL